ncbi:hypothetical protein C0J52_23889 [Blattella germanica]|nr:hypothetical protein C0J52_23889 [Blattella germanica]
MEYHENHVLASALLTHFQTVSNVGFLSQCFSVSSGQTCCAMLLSFFLFERGKQLTE